MDPTIMNHRQVQSSLALHDRTSFFAKPYEGLSRKILYWNMIALAWSLDVLDTVFYGQGSHPLFPKRNYWSPSARSWDSDLVAPCC